jgi:quinol monooxygenase YgiN
MKILLTSLVVLSFAALAGAQAPPAPAADSSRYAVAYVEVMPSKASAFTDAFHKYRDASRGEPGFVAFEAFTQSDRPGHAVVVETWKDPGSVEAQAKSATATQFRAALDAIRVSGYDERLYRSVNVRAAAASSGRGAVHVVTHADFAPGGGDPVALLNRLAEESRKDPGCVRFDVLQNPMRANHFTIIESWANAQALEAHAAAPHTRKYRDEVQPMTGSPLDERVFKAAE